MSIHVRQGKSSPAYVVRWREGNKNRSRAFPSMTEAEEFQVAVKRNARLGAFAIAEPSSMSLGAFLERWFRTSGVTWASTTMRNRASLIDRWIDPLLGHVPLRELGRARVRDFRAEILNDGSSATNTNNVIRCLSAALTAAADEGLIPGNPCLRLGKIPESKPDRETLDPTHVRLLLLGAPTERDRRVIGLCAFAALRPAEIVSLTWGDIDSDWISVTGSVQEGERGSTKTRRPRTVPVGPALKPLLAGVAENADGLVAPANEGGFLDWTNWSRDVWRPLRSRCQMSTVFYSLRHTCISRWLMDGHDPLTVASWAGHGVDVTTRVYARAIRSARRQSQRNVLRASDP